MSSHAPRASRCRWIRGAGRDSTEDASVAWKRADPRPLVPWAPSSSRGARRAPPLVVVTSSLSLPCAGPTPTPARLGAPPAVAVPRDSPWLAGIVEARHRRSSRWAAIPGRRRRLRSSHYSVPELGSYLVGHPGDRPGPLRLRSFLAGPGNRHTGAVVISHRPPAVRWSRIRGSGRRALTRARPSSSRTSVTMSVSAVAKTSPLTSITGFEVRCALAGWLEHLPRLGPSRCGDGTAGNMPRNAARPSNTVPASCEHAVLIESSPGRPRCGRRYSAPTAR